MKNMMGGFEGHDEVSELELGINRDDNGNPIIHDEYLGPKLDNTYEDDENVDSDVMGGEHKLGVRIG